VVRAFARLPEWNCAYVAGCGAWACLRSGAAAELRGLPSRGAVVRLRPHARGTAARKHAPHAHLAADHPHRQLAAHLRRVIASRGAHVLAAALRCAHRVGPDRGFVFGHARRRAQRHANDKTSVIAQRERRGGRPTGRCALVAGAEPAAPRARGRNHTTTRLEGRNARIDDDLLRRHTQAPNASDWRRSV